MGYGTKYQKNVKVVENIWKLLEVVYKMLVNGSGLLQVGKSYGLWLWQTTKKGGNWRICKNEGWKINLQCF